jgi:hypothetical protein
MASSTRGLGHDGGEDRPAQAGQHADEDRRGHDRARAREVETGEHVRSTGSGRGQVPRQ